MTEDMEIEALLRRASTPKPPEGALARMLANAGPTPGAVIIPFRKPERQRFWPAAALLAASLAAGVYLGAAGFTDSFYGDVAALDDASGLVGLSDAEDTLAGDAT